MRRMATLEAYKTTLTLDDVADLNELLDLEDAINAQD